MNFWRRLRFYLIGVTLGLIVSFSFFKNRGCGWLPGNRVLNQISSSMILRSDSVECIHMCEEITDEDIFRMLNDGDVLFGESETKTEPKRYVLQGTRSKDDSEFKIAFILRDSTAEIRIAESVKNCNCEKSDDSLAKILRMPEEMVREIFLSKDISATSHSDCQIKCRGWDGAAIRTMIHEGKIDYKTSFPRAHPHPLYTLHADSVTLHLELTEKKTRVLDIQMEDTLCRCIPEASK